jgi:transcriptional regulator with XRE-family HTH domain
MGKNQDLRRNFSENLRFLMKKRDITQQILAEATETTRQAIAQYADGTALPSVEKLYKISKFLNMSMDYFFNPINSKTANDSSVKIREICEITGLEEESVAILKNCRALVPRANFVVNCLLKNLFGKDLKNQKNQSVIDALSAYYFFTPKKDLKLDEIFAITSEGKEDRVRKVKYFEHNNFNWFESNQTILMPEFLEQILMKNLENSVKELKEKMINGQEGGTDSHNN